MEGLIVPSFSAATTIAPAIRSLTEDVGLKLSSFASNSALHPKDFGRRFSLTRGVLPTKLVMSDAMGINFLECFTY